MLPLLLAFGLSVTNGVPAADAPLKDAGVVIHRDCWSFNRSDINWYNKEPAKIEEKKKQGIINEMGGWAEYDINIPADGWYELWEKEGVPQWSRDLFVDGKMLLQLVISENEDLEAMPRQGEQGRWYKECNLWLTKGSHALRTFRCDRAARIVAAETFVPPSHVKYVRYRLAFAENLAKEMTTGRRQGDLADYERSAFLKRLDDAWNAFRSGQYCHARTSLSLPAASLVYERFGQKPDGLSFDRFPNKLAGKEPHFYTFGETVIPVDALMKTVTPDSKASLVDSSSYNPEWKGAPVLKCDESVAFDLDVPADGSYSLSIGTIAERDGVATGTINGINLPTPLVTMTPGVPEYTAFPAMSLKGGKAHVVLKRDGSFGIYGVKFLPAALRPLPTECWATVGPFPSAANAKLAYNWKEFVPLVKEGFALNFGPEQNSSLDSVYKTSDGREVRWSIPSPAPGRSRSSRTTNMK